MKSAMAKLLTPLLVAAVLVAQGAAMAQSSSSPTLDRIRQSKTIRIAYRADAPPFAYKNNLGEPAGFMVDLCKAVAQQIRGQLGLSSLDVSYVLVNSVDRFDAIRQGKADLLCEPTSATLSRREFVDFSIPTYVDGAGLLVRGDGPTDIKGLAGRQIGVLAGTTTEQALRNTLKDASISATVIPAKSHAEGLAMLDDGKISAYFADRSILQFLALQSKAPDKLSLADAYLTIEPYALALPHGDEGFRLAVDRALSHIYRGGQINTIFNKNFGGKAQPGVMLQTLYVISGYPD